MFNPSWLGQILSVLDLGGRDDGSGLIEDHEAGACCTLINRAEV